MSCVTASSLIGQKLGVIHGPPKTDSCAPALRIVLLELGVVMRRLTDSTQRTTRRHLAANPRRGSVFVEYLLLVTLVGIGVIAGLATVREALVNELTDLANAISAISGP